MVVAVLGSAIACGARGCDAMLRYVPTGDTPKVQVEYAHVLV